jgi:hypothetical protein
MNTISKYNEQIPQLLIDAFSDKNRVNGIELHVGLNDAAIKYLGIVTENKTPNKYVVEEITNSKEHYLQIHKKRGEDMCLIHHTEEGVALMQHSDFMLMRNTEFVLHCELNYITNKLEIPAKADVLKDRTMFYGYIKEFTNSSFPFSIGFKFTKESFKLYTNTGQDLDDFSYYDIFDPDKYVFKMDTYFKLPPINDVYELRY